MRLLLMDTCGSEGSVALADTERGSVIATEMLPGRSASERLLPVVKTLLKSAGWELKNLGAIVVVHGPGSFTGVRVGLSAAKGLCEAGGLGLIAVSRLAVMAALAERGGDEVCAVLDAGRGEFYAGLYASGSRLREALMPGEELRAVVSASTTVVVCEAKVAEALSDLAPMMVREPVAGDALPIAELRVVSREFDDVATIDANYLRRTDAEIFAKPVQAGSR
jgi:tRNA threonylcarbamoyladenosine biosynthesis protein TsaB